MSPQPSKGSTRQSRFALSEKTSETDDQRIRDVTPAAAGAPDPLLPDRRHAGGSADRGTRSNVRRIMAGDDDRLLVVIGPCSIHDPAAALEYARKLKAERAARRPSWRS
jgi:3-deoxy-7-phosphoheptulonate synthase